MRPPSCQTSPWVKASRWCAGCHDPVPFFSGAFDDPKFDDVKPQIIQQLTQQKLGQFQDDLRAKAKIE